MHHRDIMLAAALAITFPSWGTAQTVWRCGNSYGEQPCAGGSLVEVPPAPGPAAAASAAAAAQADARRADALEKARLEQERHAPRAIVIAPVQPPAAEPPAARKGSRPALRKPEEFTAVAPGKPGDGRNGKAGEGKAPKKSGQPRGKPTP